MNKKFNGPKVLVFDVETAPILAYVWGIWDQNVGLNQIYSDWHILSWSAKWLNGPPNKIMYADQRHEKHIENDKKILKQIHALLEEADIVVTQNGQAFDRKKLNARFVMQGLKPTHSYKHIDTMLLAKKHFAFTSNKLAYMTDKLCAKYKKLTDADKKFPGFELWKECIAGNKAAWREMERYNKQDVLSLEELYHILSPWDKTVNFNLYTDSDEVVCNCGSKDLQKRGFGYNASGKFQKYQCNSCGRYSQSKPNLLSKNKKKSLHT